MKKRVQERSLPLTEEEVVGLLNIVLLSPVDLSPEQRRATEKLCDCCRQFLREAKEAGTGPIPYLSAIQERPAMVA